MEEDERSEPSIASTPYLEHANPKPHGVTQAQLSKFQELHRRRLQMKSKFKHKKKAKDGKVLKLQEKSHNETDNIDVKADKLDASSTAKDNSASFQIGIDQILNRRPKLHWGLDAKERWERKANM
ncbi:hypothetical protein AKJ16_DCAP06156 [Drosera capensis]